MKQETRIRLDALGCSSHSCRIRKPEGQGTNGPCMCSPLDVRIALGVYRAALIKADAVADAVEWCAAHEAMVDWDCEGVQVSICNAKEGDDPFSAEDAMYKKCWPEEHAPDLPAAVTALQKGLRP